MVKWRRASALHYFTVDLQFGVLSQNGYGLYDHVLGDTDCTVSVSPFAVCVMCMYLCVCMYACMHVCSMHVCMYACLSVCMSVYVYMYACMHVCMHACMYVCT